MKTTAEVRDDSLAPGLQSALDVPSDEQGTQFHWKCFPNRMLEPQIDLSANEMVDLARAEADARSMGKRAKVSSLSIMIDTNILVYASASHDYRRGR